MLLHEIGRVLGLSHMRGRTVMNASFEFTPEQPTRKDAAAAARLYGPPQARRHVA